MQSGDSHRARRTPNDGQERPSLVSTRATELAIGARCDRRGYTRALDGVRANLHGRLPASASLSATCPPPLEPSRSQTECPSPRTRSTDACSAGRPALSPTLGENDQEAAAAGRAALFSADVPATPRIRRRRVRAEHPSGAVSGGGG